MPTGRYPFIDIAVHDNVRSRFCAGDALILVSPFLDTIFWINGAGARLLGHESLYASMDAGLGAAGSAYRQIEAAARVVRNRGGTYPFVMRSDSGFKHELRSAQIEKINLPDGNPALLISAKVDETGKTQTQVANTILDGFEDMDTHAAVLDENGSVLEATSSFARMRLGDEVRRQIVSEVSGDRERLAKHPIPTVLGQLPSAVARLSDDPGLFLLFAVEMPVDADEPASQAQKNSEPEAAPKRKPANPRPKTRVAGRPGTVPSVLNMTPQDARVEEDEEDLLDLPAERDTDAPPQEQPNSSTAAEAPSAKREPEQPVDVPAPAPAQSSAQEPHQKTADTSAFVFNPEKRPTRFVWKIDAHGVFKEISPEFAETVGPNSADVKDRKFSDVAQVFNIDPDHTIADLLRKRDTWSGKSVLWPIQGTDLRVPVDLAALPTYSREREFDGFRGFGIVRPADAETDPEKIGIALGGAGGFPAIDPGPDEPASHETVDKPAGEDKPSGAAAPAEDDETEKPALKISDTPGRRQSDKIISLQDRRSQARDGLSNTEKQAFREIAQRLGAARRSKDGDDEQPPEPFGKRASPPNKTEHGDPKGAQQASDKDNRADNTEGADPGADAAPPSGKRPLVGDQTDAPDGNSVTPAVIEQLPAPVIVHDGTTIFYINEEFRQLTGHLTKSELNRAGGMAGLFDDGDGSTGDESTSTGGDLVLKTRDGSRISVRAKLRSIRWEKGRALMLALQPLVSEQQVSAEDAGVPDSPPLQPEIPDETGMPAASALQVEVEELRSILETATDGVVLIGEDGIIRSMNNSASALFDYDEAETSGQPFAMLFAHESQRAVRDYLSGLTGNGVASVLNDGREVIGREASGGFLPLFMTIGHLSGSNGYCAVMRDITQWKRAEEELRSAKREAETASSHKSDFLARVSHEIRTPLNAIIGFAELMAEERFGPIGSPRYVEYANDIRRSGKHVLDIVNDLLDISKIEAGEQELDFAAVSLNDALLEAISILQPQANDRRVIMRTSLASDVPQVVADVRSIKQIAINLLSNAVRFTPAGGQVVVSTTYEPNGNVSLRIRDTGVGMTRAELEQAMKPFKQVAGLNRPRGEGTGLGLPLAKAMAEANRAQFAMNSQPGEGTLIEIVFPSQRVLAE
ncbi:PAS domain S-box protein [Hoeflea prorocentri]|uniref:histidine kinase n=1 Tax=Hoeflea prorocentri TaxID=1922333 RepID=A0A9X3UKI8_9HYPH|nr:PAS domain S-box protein [Hoeflea prorocentri]MCY6382344.1 PAS domain S-box protein [Hoeflea prorocentri]MDA5400144.1 PAS domain S-box protein [Hoeflea prorocentri]